MDLRKNKIGIYEKAIPNAFDWETKIKVAKEAGFDYIEISIDESDERLARLNWTDKERSELRNLLEVNGMYIESMCLSGHRKYPFGSKNNKTREKAYELMDKAFQFAIDLGINNIQLAGYDVYYEESDEETIKLFVEGLKYSARKAEKLQVMLSIEIMDTWLMGTITRCLEYLKQVNSKYLMIYPDLGNLTQWTKEPEKELEKGIDHIIQIHLKDTLPDTFKCVPFGHGDVRFVDLFNTLKELKYDKPFLIEMWADNTKTYTVEESVKELIKAKTWLNNRM